jgi:acyl-CoA thioesterase
VQLTIAHDHENLYDIVLPVLPERAPDDVSGCQLILFATTRTGVTRHVDGHRYLHERPTMNYEYDAAVELTGGDNQVMLVDRWTMGPGYAHGGYLMSIALAAAAQVSPKPDALTMSAHFVRPGRVGPATVPTDLIKAGRSLATVEADIVQDDKVVVATITTFGDLTSASDITYQSASMPDIPDRRMCIHADPSATPLVPQMADNIELLLTPDSTAWTRGVALTDATMMGWVRFADQRPIDALSLPMFADALPPPVFSVGAFAPWTPTIELTLHIRRIPDTEWLRVAFRTDLIGGTFFESSGTLWDDDGRLVAMSRQLQLIQQR